MEKYCQVAKKMSLFLVGSGMEEMAGLKCMSYSFAKIN